MGKIEEIERAIEQLSPTDVARLRAWLDERAFDAAIERDAAVGKLDHLADQALADHNAGRTRPRSGILPIRISGTLMCDCQNPLKT